MKLVRAKDGYRKVGDKYLLAKKCTVCGRWLVANTDEFHKSKTCKYGLESQCKRCRNKKNNQWRLENKDKIAKRRKQYYEANKEKEAKRKKQYYENNKEKILERGKRYRENNKEKIAERHKQYREDNKEKIKQYREDNKEKLAEYRKQYYEANKEKMLERHKQWCENNKEKVTEYQKQYREDNKDKRNEQNKQYRQTPQGQVVMFNGRQRRRAKEERQGSGITKDQWLEMMSFFDWKCAYSGERLTDKTRSIDHIVPLDAGGDNMIWNCVPMLRSLNSSKNTKDMLEWYKEQDCYDPKRLQKIYEWQEYAYNKYGKDSEYFNSGNIQIKLI